MNRIIFTGGGSAGHVTPNIALIKQLQMEQWDISYIGSNKGVEAHLIQPLKIPFYGISSGKLRRYFSWQNFLDPFKIAFGVVQSFFLCRKLKADVVFSKGGFVSFPVVVGAYLNRIPVIAHESDFTPGLANRLSFPFVKKICLTFEGAKTNFAKQEKLVVTGTPIREQLFAGDRARGLALCGFSEEKPCILVIGGSLGAEVINQLVRQSLADLCERFQVIHICGKNKVQPNLNTSGYKQFEYVDDALSDLFAASDMVISRAGANSLYELLALKKPHILIPLPRHSSRGDQIQNARYFQTLGTSMVLNEDNLSQALLTDTIHSLYQNRDQYITKMQQLDIKSATKDIIEIIKEVRDGCKAH